MRPSFFLSLFVCLLLLSLPGLTRAETITADPFAYFPPLPAKVPSLKKPGEPAPCQPLAFNPGKDKLVEKKFEDGTSYYELAKNHQEGVEIFKQAYIREGELKVLPKKTRVDLYMFGCASEYSLVVEILQKGKRAKLFTHVEAIDLSQDGRTLFLLNVVKEKGKWQRQARLLDLTTLKMTSLPLYDCISRNAYWSQNKLITVSTPSEEPGKSYQDPHDICIWNKKGKIVRALEGRLDWEVGAGYYIGTEQLRLLPDGLTLAATDSSQDPNQNQCVINLQHIQEINKFTTIPVGPGLCSDYEFDANRTSWEHPVIRFRFYSPETNEPSDWQETAQE